jgi:hypothetical protein
MTDDEQAETKDDCWKPVITKLPDEEEGFVVSESAETIVISNCPTCGAFPVQCIGDAARVYEYRFIQTNGLAVEGGHVQRTEDGLIYITDSGRGCIRSAREWLDASEQTSYPNFEGFKNRR